MGSQPSAVVCSHSAGNRRQSPEIFAKCFRHKSHKHLPLVSLPYHVNTTPPATATQEPPLLLQLSDSLGTRAQLTMPPVCRQGPVTPQHTLLPSQVSPPSRSILLGPDLTKTQSHFFTDPAPLFPKGRAQQVLQVGSAQVSTRGDQFCTPMLGHGSCAPHQEEAEASTSDPSYMARARPVHPTHKSSLVAVRQGTQCHQLSGEEFDGICGQDDTELFSHD